MKKIRVLIGGNPYHATLLAEQINSFGHGIQAKTRQLTRLNVIFHLATADIYHGIYQGTFYKIWLIAKLLRKKTVCHWIGTDVLAALKNNKLRLAAKSSDRFIDINLAGSPGLVDELKSIGIDALWMPLVPKALGEQVPPLPRSFTVLSYIPDARSDFSGASIVCQLAEALRDINFMIVGGKGAGMDYPSNVTCLGWQENMDKVYECASVLLRIIEHDGLSLMVLEALAKGRQVIWSQPFPHCYYAQDFTAAKAALLSIRKNPAINHDGSKYVKEEFNSYKICERLAKVYTGLY